MVWKGGGFASRAPPFPPGGRCHLRMIIGDSWVNCHNYWRQSQGFPLEVCGMMGRKNQGHQDGKFNSSSKVRSILQYSMSRVGWHPTDVKYCIPLHFIICGNKQRRRRRIKSEEAKNGCARREI